MDDAEFGAKIKELRNSKEAMREFLKLPGHLDRLFDLAIKAAKKKPPKRKNRSDLPLGFPDGPQINRAKGFWAQSKRPDLVAMAEAQAAEFRDYHIGAGTLAADWPATWGTWFRRAIRIVKPPSKFDRFQEQATAETPEIWRWRIQTFHRGSSEDNLPIGYWLEKWGPKPGEPGCRAPN